ncbi:MAG: AmmeMemoRadiSam system protein B, partial [Bacteroidales bacterium]|nr:AmmeMemoRadiSam system protein B [Bacteroidales bacterium]
NPAQLRSELAYYFATAKPAKEKTAITIAILSPHAGYVFSGAVAASSYNQLPENIYYEKIFLLGTSHRTYFEGASIYNRGHYVTPLGTVKVDIPLATKLIKDFNCFTFRPDAHYAEHSLEVQLPFLQYKLKQDFEIIPIILGTQSPQMCLKIADALKPFFKPGNLFIISTDFSHYPNYSDAVRIDRITAESVLSNSPEKFLKTIRKNENQGIKNLSTCMCGWTSVLTLLYLTENNPDYTYYPIDYKNSGDTKYGDKSRVVGYHSIIVTMKDPDNKTTELNFSNEEKQTLLKIARNTIIKYVSKQKVTEPGTEDITLNLKKLNGVFVTIYKKGKLRGCVGQFRSRQPLYKLIQDMAISSSTKDHRFPPVTEEELDQLDIEISVLSPMKKIESIDEIDLGKHGIYIVKGSYSGTFLPKVAVDNDWNKEELLGHCARDKARIGWDGWKDADIYIYEAYIFSE